MALENVKYVMVGSRKFDIEGSAQSLAEVKAAAVEVDASLANADAVIEGDTVVFKFRAGTKGAGTIGNITKVVAEGRTYDVDPTMYSNPQDIKEALLEAHPSLANADYVVSGDTMSFVFRAGTKGC